MTKRLGASGAFAVVLSLGLAACSNPYDPTQRAVAGGMIGAGSGAALGAIAGGGTGAAIGAGFGAVAGAVTGVVTTPPPPQSPPPLR
jgi:YMGG-like Gly-zipper